MPDHDERTITSLIHEYHVRFGAGDIDAVLDLWDEDGSVFEPGNPVARGTAQLRGAYERGYAGADYHFDCEIEDVVLGGDLAAVLSHATGTVRVKSTGEVIHARARQVFTARRVGGNWKLLHYMFQDSKAPEG